MLTRNTFKSTPPFQVKPHESHPGLSSVFAAAVVNQRFREQLLSNPELALRQGYLGKSFSLSQEEKSLIVSTNAKSLTDLAQQVVSTFRK